MTAGLLPLPDRQTLARPDLQATFARDGWVKVPLLDAAQVERLREIYAEVYPESMDGFVPTYAVPAPERKARANALVREVLEPVVVPLLDRYRPFNTSYLMKWPGEDSALPLHQDTCYVDERLFRSVVAWIALDDADDDLDNGPLRAVPGSHRFDRALRGTHTWWPYDDAAAFIEEHCLVPLPVQRGDALLMDNAVIHCSYPNRSGAPRLAVALALAPEEAGLIHAAGDEDGRVTLHDVDERFFVEHTPYDLMDHGVPDRCPAREIVAPEQRQLSAAEVAELCGLPASLAPVEPEPVPEPAPELSDAGADTGAAEDEEPGGQGRVADAVQQLMALNNRVVARVQPNAPILDPSPFPWIEVLEREWKAIRAEAEEVLDGRLVPRIEEVVGRSQGNEGDWRTFVLVAHREPVEFNAARCPTTTDLLRGIPELQSALFSVFSPGTHLPAHHGPNRGVLRYHLGLIVPDPPGSCRLRVEDETVAWEEGASVLFDDTYEHEAWNDADHPRVTLLLELVRPLPLPFRALNALTQRAFALYPEARGSVQRLEALDWALNGTGSNAGHR